MSRIVIAEDQRAIRFLIMIGIHYFLHRQTHINQFTEKQQGRTISKFNFPANKPNQVPALFKVYIGRFDEWQTGKQIQYCLEISFNQFLPQTGIDIVVPAGAKP